MRTISIAAALLAFNFSVEAQMQSFDVASPGSTGNNYGNVHFYDPAAIGQKNASVLHYSDIEGSPYLNEHWSPAFLFLRSGGAVKLKNVKLNLYTGDVVYIDNKGTELAALPGMVRRIVFLNEKDTTNVTSLFEAFPDSKVENGYTYYKILSDGKWKLLELQKSLIRTVPLDALADKRNESSFFLKISYAIANEETVFPLKTLGYSAISSVLQIDKNADQWLKENKNGLKKESDVIAYLQYCNSQKK